VRDHVALLARLIEVAFQLLAFGERDGVNDRVEEAELFLDLLED